MPRKSGKVLRHAVFGDFIYDVDVEADEEDGGYIGNVVGLPGCLSDGDTVEELLENIKDAIKCYLEALDYMKREGMPVKVNLNARRRRKTSA